MYILMIIFIGVGPNRQTTSLTGREDDGWKAPFGGPSIFQIYAILHNAYSYTIHAILHTVYSYTIHTVRSVSAVADLARGPGGPGPAPLAKKTVF